MGQLTKETVNSLIRLGILDNELNITPDAYQGVVARKPVIEQAHLLGLPLIHRPYRTNGGSPEKQFVSFFSKRIKSTIDGGESYNTFM